jgi:oligopeptide/dipeptide ABC transporter ATP-binding protein
MRIISRTVGRGGTERWVVMLSTRAGIERAGVRPLFKSPQHTYNHGLLRSMPRLDEYRINRLQTIGGQPPNLQHLPDGCRFRDRCSYAFDRCAVEKPLLRQIAEGRAKTCHLESL